MRSPFEGIGKPEPLHRWLVGRGPRLDDEHRLVSLLTDGDPFSGKRGTTKRNRVRGGWWGIQPAGDPSRVDQPTPEPDRGDEDEGPTVRCSSSTSKARATQE